MGMITKIELITTGGTIDGTDSDKGTARAASAAASWLSKHSTIKIIHNPLLNKDSRTLTDLDRAKIVEAALGSSSECILITHGTFTICKTGRVLKQAAAQKKSIKTVLLVGSWLPFGEMNSDAPLQMEFALRSLAKCPKGIWIAMDNRLWNPDTTEKIETSRGIYKLSQINT